MSGLPRPPRSAAANDTLALRGLPVRRTGGKTGDREPAANDSGRRVIEAGCPFCAPEAERVFHAGDRTLGLWDGFAVSPGHALLVPKRHIASWFDASPEEQAELLSNVAIAWEKILERHQPDGFNIGINVGAAAGQTVFHLHLHVIPRYAGDVADPRGGVRHVIPGKGNYLVDAGGGAALAADRDSGRYEFEAPSAIDLPHGRALVSGGDDPLLPHLLPQLDRALRADIAVAFVVEGGLNLLEEHLRDLLKRNGQLRILTGDYFDVTEPNALLRLLDLELEQEYAGQVELRVFECGTSSFHPKAYLFYESSGDGVAYVGSSNLTRSALTEGVEWNYRAIPSRDHKGFHDVVGSFEALFQHPATRPLDAAWVDAYRRRRREQPPPQATTVELPQEAPEPPPAPHEVQTEALATLEATPLEATRAAGNSAGLVVLATGLGKTWLSAFDSQRPEFRRVLFVAHREEILGQAVKTFRRIRPEAHLGLYTGQEKTPDAEVLFASVQTLGKARHLQHFAPDEFDYIIVDEFHHAAAKTYRRLIDHFEPEFLLGLTATPERTDGGDLLALCQENLVYRCDVAEGIRRGLLSPFHYFGVPDEVDYANIPWRSSRFDEEALTTAVATQSRAENALEQYREHAGGRTLAFCCSKRHADFMHDFFRDAGLRVAAVHSGEGSDPRSGSLEKLRDGDLDVVFAVDMFNEGVDLPNVDTVIMLRPTESRILWLQQFGRGLRKADDKDHLTVIDYIGNHRTFLLKPQTLFELGAGDAEIRDTLNLLAHGELELPPGCEVTYELEAIEILRTLLRPLKGDEAIRFYYGQFQERQGQRPRAVEAYHDGYNPRATRKGFGSWLGFVSSMRGLGAEEENLVKKTQAGRFLGELETTQMTRSFKMLVLLAMLNSDCLPGEIPLDTLADGVARIARRSAALRADVGPALDDHEELKKLLRENPIEAWIGGKGTGGTAYFSYGDGIFRTTFDATGPARDAVQEFARELTDWRLAEYLSRGGGIPNGPDQFVCNVSHANQRPIIFLPDREKTPGIPSGWTDVAIDGNIFRANFVRIAVNVVTHPDSEENKLPEILSRWFGGDAGLPGTSHRVAFERNEDGFLMKPVGGSVAESGLTLWQSYVRSDIPPAFGLKFVPTVWNQGFVLQGGDMFLLVTLDKSLMPQEHRYGDRFISRDDFEWMSQNRTAQASKHGKAIQEHAARGISVHLLVRAQRKHGARGAPFIYCGNVDFTDWEGEKPIRVRWRLQAPLPDQLWSVFAEKSAGA